jgi:hypothetical protein
MMAAIVEKLDQVAVADAPRGGIRRVEIDRLAPGDLARPAIGAGVELAVQPPFGLVGQEMERVARRLFMAQPFKGFPPDRMAAAILQRELGDAFREDLDPAR